MGWVCFGILLNDYEVDDEGQIALYIISSLIGLGLIPIIHCLIIYYDNYKEPLIKTFKWFYNFYDIKKIKVIPCKIDENGLIKYDGYLCYNLSEFDYRGQINIKIEKLNYKKMQKIITKLEKWGNEEQLKNARLTAIKEVKLK
jgi:hypothetical protein